MGTDKYPSVDQLPADEQLPDPFQFFGCDRRVKTREDWEQRQAEMMEMLEHYIYGLAFPQVNKYRVDSRTKEDASVRSLGRLGFLEEHNPGGIKT